MEEPHRFWTIFFIVLAGGFAAGLVYLPASQSNPWFIGCAAGFLVSFFSAGFLSVEWIVKIIEHEHRERRISDAITPTSVAADKLRFLSSEAISKIPQWEHALKIGHILTPAGREDVLITNEAVLPYGFILDFLERSSYTRCEKIGSYSDTPGQRDFAQALTAELCRKGYAIPAHGNDPALWLTADSRARFARELGIEMPEGM